MTAACATETHAQRKRPMAPALTFAEAPPRVAAARLDADAIHLWRFPYAASRGRAPLLALLAAYLDVPAAAVELDHDARGKPRLAPATMQLAGHRHLDFNWSHSGDYALIALARDCALGVDIERQGKDLRALEIARRFFAPAEAEALAPLDGNQRDDAFIALWCAKEAVLKAAGVGLSFGLSRLVFSAQGERGWKIAHTDPALGAPGDWRLESLDPVAGYRGALAWRGAARRIVALRPTE
jgi:4'-phosphopantetheinyl transferase